MRRSYMALAAMSMAGILLCATTWSHNLAPTQPAPTLSVASPLRLYGSVTKHGPVVGLSQLASLFQAENTTTARLAGQLYYPHSWRTQRLLGRRPEHEGRLCGLMYSDSLKIILVKSAKTAGSSLLAFFQGLQIAWPRRCTIVLALLDAAQFWQCHASHACHGRLARIFRVRVWPQCTDTQHKPVPLFDHLHEPRVHPIMAGVLSGPICAG